MNLTIERTLASVALRQFTGNRKALWVVLVAWLPVGLALMVRALSDDTYDERMEGLLVLYQMLVVRVLLPLAALVIGTSVFGGEIEDGTVTYVLGKPVARWRIILTRVVAAALATAAVVVPPTVATGLVMLGRLDHTNVVWGFTSSVMVGGALYCALFVALSLRTRRALVAGLLYVIMWEGTLGGLFAGTRALSIREYTLAMADAISTVRGSLFTALLPGQTALIMGALVIAAIAVYSVRSLQSFEIGEAA
ncbi:MAG TPA: ABC transporter permease subunit [Longimicrobium sp.]|jgi:ABC-2 type transport system permease protein|uniref:ABC transporter permease subunit n=1 Tax=Longimicrobium sp. TaxID=2029185 RepID=UPI002ED9CAD7